MKKSTLLFGGLIFCTSVSSLISNCFWDTRNPEQYLTRLLQENQGPERKVCNELSDKIDFHLEVESLRIPSTRTIIQPWEKYLVIRENLNCTYLSEYKGITTCPEFVARYNEINELGIDLTICELKWE